MATKKDVTKYRGSQILKLPKYDSRVARIVVKPNELYSVEEVDELVSKYMKKKG